MGYFTGRGRIWRSAFANSIKNGDLVVTKPDSVSSWCAIADGHTPCAVQQARYLDEPPGEGGEPVSVF